MHVELHDKDGRVEVAELNCEGRHEAIFQAKRLIEEIEEVDYPEDEDDEEPLPRTAEGDMGQTLGELGTDEEDEG